tara:strand:+ start:271 stop:510 length:240 start_codon:yes stop_codon:yes gene_type:complete
MENNKLIAEFMNHGFHDGRHRSFDELKYNESWDWLMPVISKVETVGRGWFPHELHTSLMKNDIDNAYNSVVEFIKQYNK